MLSIVLKKFVRPVFVYSYHWLALIAAVGVLYYLYKKDVSILARIKSELRLLFWSKNGVGEKYHNEIAHLGSSQITELVVDASSQNHLQILVAKSRSQLLNDFLKVLSEWRPKNCHYEYEFQDKLCAYLNKRLPGITVESEKPIGETTLGNRGRADIVINDTILIEMKRDSSAGAIQRAKGQILQYSEVWKNKGPVILLLCNHEYEHARTNYSNTLADLVKLDRTALAIVSNN